MRDIIAITFDATSVAPELTAAEWRQIDGGLFARDSTGLAYPGIRGGVVSNTGFAVTITPLTAVVQTSGSLGAYRGAFPAGAAELAKTISAAHATLPRVDAIDVKVYDTEADGSGLRGMDIVYTAGTAASSPAAPTFTGVGLRLGTFAVPASGGGNPVFTPNASLMGYSGPGGVLSVAARPANPGPGLEIYNRATGVREIYDQGGWRNLLGAAWVDYTTSWTSPGGSLSIGSGIKTAQWKDLGNEAKFKIYMQRASDSNLGDGVFAWTVPVAATNYPEECGPGFYRRASAPTVTMPLTWAFVNSTAIGAWRCSDGARLGTAAFTGASGDEWVLGGSYEKTQA
jgi:hypothetical protein